ncbi:unnamed protein product [Rhizoctonia solani]|uniref:Uncharacterized protein n=1 Tax=Rhizoctonia solani TaxID=456999 RepID=A0A8H3A755_9AGAM|nr:unnamed protein product [Rhizoctonia solani]
MIVPSIHTLRQPLLDAAVPYSIARIGYNSGTSRVRYMSYIPRHGLPRLPAFLGPILARRSFATPVDIVPDKLVRPAPDLVVPTIPIAAELPPLEKYIYDRILNSPVSAPLSRIYTEYRSHAGRVLDVQLPYEPRPNLQRRIKPLSGEDDGIALVAHLAVTRDGRCRVSLSSGFALNFDVEGEGEQCVATCCHSLEEITRTVSPDECVSPSGLYVFPTSGSPIPVIGVHSSLPGHDILLLSIPHTTPRLKTLPLSPYPAPNDSPLSIRLLSSHGQPEISSHKGKEEWTEWLNGFALRKWAVGGKVLGYRDLAGRESKPGTYDALSHMLIDNTGCRIWIGMFPWFVVFF